MFPTRELFGLTNVCHSVGKFTSCLRTKVDADNMSGMRLLAVGRCPLWAAEMFLSKMKRQQVVVFESNISDNAGQRLHFARSIHQNRSEEECTTHKVHCSTML